MKDSVMILTSYEVMEEIMATVENVNVAAVRRGEF